MRLGIALGGFSGVGKTTVGRCLAAELDLPFVDTDALLTRMAGPPDLQLARDGERVFRARERAVIASLAHTPQVIATGGGAWVDPANRAALAERAWLVVLVAPLAVIRDRVAGEGRWAWSGAVEARFAARAEAYAIADRVVDTGGCAADEVAAALASWWRALPIEGPRRALGSAGG
jgi:shikimate kinase